MTDELTKRRIHKRIQQQLADIRRTGWLVDVIADLGDAAVIDAFDGEGESLSMWIDPFNRYEGLRKKLAAAHQMSSAAVPPFDATRALLPSLPPRCTFLR